MVVNHCKLLLPQTLPATMTRKINEKKKKTKKPITYQNHPDCVSLHNLVSFRRVLEQKLWGFPLRFTI